MSNISIHIKSQYCYYFVFCIALFFPSLPEVLDSAGAFLVNVIIIACCVLFFLVSGNSFFKLPKYVFIGLVFVIFPFFCLPLSMVVGVGFSDVPISNRDFFDFYRPVLAVCSILLGYLVFKNDKSELLLPKFLSVCCFFILCLAAIQFSQSFPQISGLYTKFMNLKSNRLAVPFVNPYDFSFVMSFFLFFFLFRSFFISKRNLVGVVVLFVFIFLSQSRAGFIALILSLVLIFSPYYIYRSFGSSILKPKKSLIFYFVVIISFLLVFVLSINYIQENFRYFSVAFEQLASGQRINSASVRAEQFSFALEKADDSILVAIFGNGPAKEQMPYVESIYTYLFYRFGLLGFFCYWTFWFLYIRVIVKILNKTTRSNYMFTFFCALLVWVCSVPLFSIANNLTEQLRTSFIYYSLFGVSVAYYYARVRSEIN